MDIKSKLRSALYGATIMGVAAGVYELTQPQFVYADSTCTCNESIDCGSNGQCNSGSCSPGGNCHGNPCCAGTCSYNC